MPQKRPKPQGAVAALLQQVTDHANTTLIVPATQAANEKKHQARTLANSRRQAAHQALRAAATTNFESIICAYDDSIVRVSRPDPPGCDAVIHWHTGDFYFFRGKEYLRCNANLEIVTGYPKTIRSQWSRWPRDWTDGVDAAIRWPNGKAYFFKGAEYLRYTPGVGVDHGYPKLISEGWPQLPTSWANGVDAICHRFSSRGHKTFLFKGKKYLRYTPTVGVDSGYPKTIAGNWGKWPQSWRDGVSAAVTISNTKTYFFKRNQFMEYKHNTGVKHGFPRPISSAWDGWPKHWLHGSPRTKTSVLSLAGSTSNVGKIALDIDWQSMLWQQTSPLKIWRCNYDGTGRTCLIDRSHLPAGTTITFGLDAENQKVYWLEYRGRSARLFRANVQDGRPTLLTTKRNLTSNNPDLGSMVVDSKRKRLYWTDGSVLYRAKTNGSNLVELHRFKTSAGNSGISLALDQVSGLIYWNDPDTAMICSANPNGPSLSEQKTLYPWTPFGSTTRFPGLFIESTTALIYWLIPSGNKAELHIGTTDGSFDMGPVLKLKKPGPFIVVTKTEEVGLKRAAAYAEQAAAQRKADEDRQNAHAAAAKKITDATTQKTQNAATAATRKQTSLASASKNRAAANKKIVQAKKKKSTTESKRTSKTAAAKAAAQQKADRAVATAKRANHSKISKKRHQVSKKKRELHSKKK